MRHGQRIAAPGRRWAATAIDLSILLPGAGLAVLAAAKLIGDRLGNFDLSSSHWRPLIDTGIAALGVPSRNSRSPGMRIMGLRTVDARTGGPVTVRTVIARDAVRTVEKAVLGAASRPARARVEAQREAMKPRRKEIRRQYANDPEGERRAMRELYQDNAVNPLKSCAPFLIAGVADQLAMFVTPRRQTLHELLAGTIVVSDD